MATIRASWKRTVQVKQYESETLELAVEQEIDVKGPETVECVANLDRTLAAAGDALVLERLNLRVTEATNAEPENIPLTGASGVKRLKKTDAAAPKTTVIPMTKVEAPAGSDEPDEYLFAK
jgi:hypothetical protein